MKKFILILTFAAIFLMTGCGNDTEIIAETYIPTDIYDEYVFEEAEPDPSNEYEYLPELSPETVEMLPEIPAHLAKTFAAVINNDIPFTFFGFAGTPLSDGMFGSDLVWTTPTFDSIFFEEYFEHPTIIYTWEIASFAFVDMNGDGNVQLILRSDADGDALILHYAGDGVVHGFGIPQRQFQSLSTDGTFLQLSWMQDWGAIARLHFAPEDTANAIELVLLHEWNQDRHHEGLLYLDGEYMDFTEGWAIVEGIREHHGSKEPAIWYPFEVLLDVLDVAIPLSRS
ncbi:MAG: hypothetical protein FWD03_10365 [Defluviitaleaceae bacterium]|nr:hypothetical protein [Defluviitaleaceae bacterium]